MLKIVRRPLHYIVVCSRSDSKLWTCIPKILGRFESISNSCPLKSNALQLLLPLLETAPGASNLQAIIANIKQRPQSTLVSNNHCLWLIDVGSTIKGSSPSWILTLTYAENWSMIVKSTWEQSFLCEGEESELRNDGSNSTRWTATVNRLNHYTDITLIIHNTGEHGWWSPLPVPDAESCVHATFKIISAYISLLANSWWFFLFWTRVSCILYQCTSSFHRPGPLRQTTSWKMPIALHPAGLPRRPRPLPQQPSTPNTMTCHFLRALRCLAVGVWIRICWCRGHMRWILEVMHARCRSFHPGHMRHDTVEHEEMRMWTNWLRHSDQFVLGGIL